MVLKVYVVGPKVDLRSGCGALVSALPTTFGRESVTVLRLLAALLVTVLSTLLPQHVQAASSNPPGAFVDLQVFSDDSASMCSLYLNKGKVTAYVQRIDGTKIEGKKYWELKTLKKEILAASQIVKLLKKNKSPAGKKKYNKKKASLDKLLRAKSQLTQCIAINNVKGESSSVSFEHVQGIIQKDCMTCHGPLGWQNSEEAFKASGKVVAGNLEASPFYTFLSNNSEGYQPAYMPKGLPALSDQKLLLLARWIMNIHQEVPPTPTPGGILGEGRNLYNVKCSGCHGLVDVSSKWGKNATQIQAAMGSVPQMVYLRSQLSNEQIEKIALALSNVAPPQEGTVSVSSLGPVLEGNPGDSQRYLQFEVRLSGTTSQPFTVGYVSTSGSALADSDFEFVSGTVQFQGSDQESHIINVPVIADSFSEQDESVFVDIGGVNYGGVRVLVSTASGIITNDDGAAPAPPPQASRLRAGYGFNGNYTDVLGAADAQPQGSLTFTSAAEARIGSAALRFDDSTDYLLVPGRNLGNFTNFTLATWVYWENASSTTSPIFEFGKGTGSYIYFLPRASDGKCRFVLKGAAVTTYSASCVAGPVPSNQWVHVATTYDTTAHEMKIYLNGVLAGSLSNVTPPMADVPLTNNLIARSRFVGGVDFQGRMDELMIWDAALSATEVVQVMQMSSSPALSSSIEVRSDGQIIPNGSILDFGSVQTGATVRKTLFIQNNGLLGLGISGTPMVQIGGLDASAFTVKVQPMPWQTLIGVSSMATFMLEYSPTISGAKNATLILQNSDVANGNFALALHAGATGDPIVGSSGGSEEDPALVEGRNLYEVNCSSCHGGLSHSAKLGRTYEEVVVALSQVPQMQPLSLASDQVQKITLALNSAPAAEEPVPYVGASVFNVGSASYVISVLTNIFLPEDPATYITSDNDIAAKINEGILGKKTSGNPIGGRAPFFGYPRQRFDTEYRDELRRSTLTPGSNTVRSGLLQLTCDMVTEQDRAVTTALGKVGIGGSDSITPSKVKDLYEKLFAHDKTLPTYIAEAVSTFPNDDPNFSQLDKWRFILNYFCTSGVSEGI